jgi:stearoyl-CoA desaturase (Delta-9 desaturase)
MGEQTPMSKIRISTALRAWVDAAAQSPRRADADRIDWPRALPFVGLHLACLGVIWAGVSATAIVVALATYALRLFALTAFYHRYFSHRTFRTSRVVQFVFALIGATCAQRGPLWWAAHHRNHHRHADTAADPHSPRVHGFIWSHAGWFLTPRAFGTDLARVRDFAVYPELRWLDASIPCCRRCSRSRSTCSARGCSAGRLRWKPAARSS